MKKILVTTLALSLAVISGLDARVMQRRGRGRSQSLPVQQIAQKTQDMKDAQKDGDIKAAVQLANQVQNAVGADPKAAELWNAVKDVEAKKREIEGLQAELKELKVSWFGTWTNTDYKTKAAQIKTAKSELKSLQAKEAELRGQVGADIAGAIKVAALGTAVIAVAAGIADWYFETGYAKAGYAKGGELYSSGITKAGDLYKSGRGMVSSGWNRLRGNANTTVVGESVVNPPVDNPSVDGGSDDLSGGE